MTEDRTPRRAVDLLASSLPFDTLALVPRSFDIVGSIAIVEIPGGLGRYQRAVARAIMEVHKPIRTVLKKTSAMSGKYRVRRLQHIGGERTTETIYRESGVQMKMDVAKVYFSVRLSNERLRIAGQVKAGENVLVFFAGVGPFALVIAKQHQDAQVVGIDINPIAARYFKENIVLNKLKNCTAVQGDVHRVAKKYSRWADRIIMPLPHTASEFLDEAFGCAQKGAVVHYYQFGDSEKPFEEARANIRKAARRNGRRVKILQEKVVRPYAARIVQVALDIRVRNPARG